jgi:hypothetical protein
MTHYDAEELQRVIAEMAVLIDREQEPDPQLYALFFQHPEYAFQLIELINNLGEEIVQDGPPIYSACVFAFDICIAQLQAASEMNNKIIAKSLIQLMDRLADLINTEKHSLSYWLPVLNAFYEVHVELTQKLKDAYLDLASREDELDEDSELTHLDSIRNLIHELSDLSAFEIAENFFAQSYAMPADFFVDLLVDLYSIAEGQDIALLTLLHPKFEVREIVIATLDQILEQVTLSSISLSRLQAIKYWYSQSYHSTFDRWIKNQRKKGVLFEMESPIKKSVHIKATEVDGSGSQGLFIHIRKARKNRLGGLLIKYGHGLKDAWMTPVIATAEIGEYYHQAFEENVTLREVDLDYFQLVIEHFLATTIKQGEVPHLHFLELQEALGTRLKPKEIDLDVMLEELGIQISPFTQVSIDGALSRSKSWLKTKQFTESWYIENPLIDKIVNHNSSFIDGVKVCRLETAMEDVFAEEMELNRAKWQFHFLWLALWLKAKARKNEKVWQDSFLISYVIKEGRPLKDIPVMMEICRQTVINSVETMQERRTHLSRE